MLLVSGRPTAAGEGFYVGGAGGVNWTRDAKFTDRTSGGQVKFDYDRGWVGALSAGYATAMGLRAELEANHRWGNDIGSDNDPFGSWTGKARSLGFMGNLLVPTASNVREPSNRRAQILIRVR